jgi:hypothetical protein
LSIVSFGERGNKTARLLAGADFGKAPTQTETSLAIISEPKQRKELI